MGFHGCTTVSNNITDKFIYDKDSYFTEGVAVLESVLESCGIENEYSRKQLRLQIATEILIRE